MKTDKLLFGAAYYDEYLPVDRIETDMEMMEKAEMNVIRKRLSDVKGGRFGVYLEYLGAAGGHL